MNPLKWAKGKYLSSRASHAKKALLEANLVDCDPDDFSTSLSDPTTYYLRAFQDFHRAVPAEVREHRAYFRLERRGFGEDAFHTMWCRLMKRYRPSQFLEIGVYRGQTISLVSLLARVHGFECDVTGISPFSSAGDSVSNYSNEIDYRRDTLSNFRHFNLPEPVLLEAFSTDRSACDLIRSRKWDIIYIDGNHDYEVVRADWEVCARALAPGGLIVLDDSGLSTSYRPPCFATGGHPGPSKLASEIGHQSFTEILQVGHNRVFRKKSN